MSISAFDHPFLSGLLGDEEISAYFSVEADIRTMLAFEAALAKAEARHDVIPQAAAQRIAQVCPAFQPDIASLKSATAIDGVVIPDLVEQLRQAVGGEAGQHVHFGATSQDVIDSSLMIRLKGVCRLLSERLSAIDDLLQTLDAQFGHGSLTGYTRMQEAFAITVSDRLRSWSAPLTRHRERLANVTFAVQFGGAVGTLDKLGEKGSAVRASLAQELDLSDEPQWHSQRGRVADLAGLFSQITGSFGKIGQDIALMAQTGTEITLSGGGTSSAMAHKQNPVAAEALIALARFNGVQISAIHQSLVHEQERSGAAWTLEWMVFPQMAAACGTAVRLGQQVLRNIQCIGKVD